MQRCLRVIQSIDDNVRRMLDFLDQNGLTENTLVSYTTNQGFFLGDFIKHVEDTLLHELAFILCLHRSRHSNLIIASLQPNNASITKLSNQLCSSNITRALTTRYLKLNHFIRHRLAELSRPLEYHISIRRTISLCS